MTLATMFLIDKDAVLCDLAETYHIYSIEELPISKVALFACGLRDSSRIKLKITGLKVPLETLLLSQILDDFNNYLYSMTKDSKSGINRPQSLTNKLIEKVSEDKEYELFENSEEFNKQWRKLVKQING